MRKFIFPDDDDELENPKYKFGDDLPNFKQIQNITFSFAFDYLSIGLQKISDLCFDNPAIEKADYIDLLLLLNELSSQTLDDLENDKQKYHFHLIDINEKTFLKTPLKNLLGIQSNRNIDYPALYQIALYTDNQTQKAPRIVGFIGKYAIFHLLWFDYNHSIYRMRL
jgi:hypothetical protein